MHVYRHTWIVVAAASVALATLGCTSGGSSTCTPQITLQPAPSSDRLTLQANAAHALTATVTLCAAEATTDPSSDYKLTWQYDDNGNLVIDSDETQAVAEGTSWTLFACASDVGSHLLRITAQPRSGGENLTRDIEVRIQGVSTSLQRPACVAGAIATVKNQEEVDPNNLGELQAALDDCLAPWLEQNLCDFEASYAAGLAEFALFNAKTPERWENRNSLSVQDVVDIYNGEVLPLLQRFLVVAEKAPEDFQFNVSGKFEVRAFEDIENLEGDETTLVLLQGDHDMGDVRGIAAFNHAIRGIFEIILAYKGLARWILDLPPPETIDFDFFRKSFVGHAIDDPTFLTIDDESSPSGRARLLAAQDAFVNFFVELERAVAFVRQETDSQKDDIFRYWDCGADGICNCSDFDEVFLDCPNNPADYTGPDDDGTEGNGRYDPGEPVGTDRLGIPTYDTIDLPSDLDEFIRQTSLIRDNIRGPDALDLNELANGFGVEEVMRTVLAIPVPAIRLSEWFVTPIDPRLVIPLYSIRNRDVIFDIEGEPWDDVGYDGRANEDERIVHWPNPRGLTIGTEWDLATNPDPAFDDFDPFCNPVCNFNDDIDNDADGLADDDDRFIFEGGFSNETDGGPENNLVFDYVDLDFDYTHDPGEPAENFEDTGVRGKTGALVAGTAGNGRWDFADSPHEFPNGADVGPVGDIVQTDPPDGSSGGQVDDQLIPSDNVARITLNKNLTGTQLDYEGLFDAFYFFFVDPTFSGVLTFPEEVISINGEPLTDNAKLMRFFAKIVEFANTAAVGERSGDGADVGVRDGNGHPCAHEPSCLEAINLVQSQP